MAPSSCFSCPRAPAAPLSLQFFSKPPFKSLCFQGNFLATPTAEMSTFGKNFKNCFMKAHFISLRIPRPLLGREEALNKNLLIELGRKFRRLIARFIQGTGASQSVTAGRTSHFNQDGIQAIIHKEVQWSCDEWKAAQAENSQEHFKGKLGNGRRNLFQGIDSRIHRRWADAVDEEIGNRMGAAGDGT